MLLGNCFSSNASSDVMQHSLPGAPISHDGRPPAVRLLRRAPDRAKHELAHRAPVARSRVAALLEVAADDQIGRRAVLACRFNHLVGEMAVVYAFDTLGYAKRLREGGVPNPQAEAHAEAAREFIMIELVTKQDLQAAIETQTLRLTVRLGGIVAAGFGCSETCGRG